MRKILISSLCLLAACERTALSPVEIKIDDEIGGFATASSVSNTYLVAQGETLFDIANKFNIDPMNLAKVNNLKSPYNVRPGQVLKLPIEKEETSREKDGQEDASYMPVNLDENSNQDTKELDDNFERIMKADTIRSEVPGSDAAASTKSTKSETKTQAATEKSANSQGFNEQAQSLSSPKVTSTATGAKITKETSKASSSSGKMVRPLDGKVISRFGDNLDGTPNDGINIKASAGTPVKAVSEGEVIYAGNNLDESFGNVVVIQHKNGVISSYAHLKDINVKKGAQITKGQKVGSVGKTGDVSTPQLHLEIMKNSTPENPEKYIGKI
ncbi:MAG: M23 family metallopeptidase [Alphaproteobacteria bacterium]|nr:M23 family metallopeptidase [Alphaproteobacteria bacterium]MBO7641701.1 M23 family metallopeptidase [Alphaproteobacteria bacterium]